MYTQPHEYIKKAQHMGKKHPLNKLRAHTRTTAHIASTPLNKMLYFRYIRMVAHGGENTSEVNE